MVSVQWDPGEVEMAMCTLPTLQAEVSEANNRHSSTIQQYPEGSIQSSMDLMSHQCTSAESIGVLPASTPSCPKGGATGAGTS